MEQINFDANLQFDALKRFFSRADRTSLSHEADLSTRLLLSSGVAFEKSKDVPIAAIQASLLPEAEQSLAWFARLDPVVVTPNRDYLMLLGNEFLDLEDEEAESLVKGLNEFLHEDGLKLSVLSGEEWIVSSDKPFDIQTVPLLQALGNDVKTVMPAGKDASYWNKLINEIQMWLHTSEVNQRRTQAGVQPVNSVWLWGSGQKYNLECAANKICLLGKKNTIVHAIARNCHYDFIELDDDVTHKLTSIHNSDSRIIGRICLESLHDQQLLEDLIRAGLQMLSAGKIRELRIESDTNRYTATKMAMMRFWRKQKPLN